MALLALGVDAASVSLLNRGMREAADRAEQIQRALGRTSDHIGAIAASMSVGGGTGAQGGALSGLARLTGDDPNGIAGAARDFRERLAGSPLAQGTLGHGALAAGTGQLLNESRLYLEAQRQILEARTDEEARVKAQVYGLEKLLPLRDADAELVQKQITMAEENGRLVDADLRRQRGNLQALGSIRATAWERLLIEVERDMLPFKEAWERLLGGLANTLGGIPHPGLNLPRAATDLLTGNWSDLGSLIGEAIAQRLQGKPATPQDRNTQALNANTEELMAMRKDWLNGRERTNAAFPRNLGGEGLKRSLENQAFDLGAVTF